MEGLEGEERLLARYLIGEGSRLRDGGQFREALKPLAAVLKDERLYGEALESNEERAAVHILLADCLCRCFSPQQAESHLVKALRISGQTDGLDSAHLTPLFLQALDLLLSIHADSSSPSPAPHGLDPLKLAKKAISLLSARDHHVAASDPALTDDDDGDNEGERSPRIQDCLPMDTSRLAHWHYLLKARVAFFLARGGQSPASPLALFQALLQFLTLQLEQIEALIVPHRHAEGDRRLLHFLSLALLFATAHHLLATHELARADETLTFLRQWVVRTRFQLSPEMKNHLHLLYAVASAAQGLHPKALRHLSFMVPSSGSLWPSLVPVWEIIPLLLEAQLSPAANTLPKGSEQLALALAMIHQAWEIPADPLSLQQQQLSLHLPSPASFAVQARLHTAALSSAVLLAVAENHPLLAVDHLCRLLQWAFALRDIPGGLLTPHQTLLLSGIVACCCQQFPSAILLLNRALALCPKPLRWHCKAALIAVHIVAGRASAATQLLSDPSTTRDFERAPPVFLPLHALLSSVAQRTRQDLLGDALKSVHAPETSHLLYTGYLLSVLAQSLMDPEQAAQSQEAAASIFQSVGGSSQVPPAIPLDAIPGFLMPLYQSSATTFQVGELVQEAAI